MDTDRFVDAVTDGSRRLADAAEVAGIDAPLPTCPGWTVRDLLEHVVGGDNWARTIVAQAGEGVIQSVDRMPPEPGLDGPVLLSVFRSGAEELAATLRAVDPATPAWTFSPSDRTAAFWRRRRAHESTVHRCDAEAAAGSPTGVDADLAVDGIDELLTVFLPRRAANFDAVGDATVHLHCTDADGEWLVARRDSELTVVREHAKGDVAVRGAAADLYLFVWGRVPADRLEVFGDTGLLDRFSRAISV
jgi:uncharacterized protein (TIGR03083 family)